MSDGQVRALVIETLGTICVIKIGSRLMTSIHCGTTHAGKWLFRYGNS